MDWIFYGTCETCPNKAFFIRKRLIKVPGEKDPAKSKKKMCGKCFKKVKIMLISNHESRT